MILHVLSACEMKFDYMVGSQLEGFDTMVRLSHDAPVIILEGDEYLSSPIDRRPKFHLYHADIALLSGIAWDHINVFPTFDNYVEQFRIFVRQLPADGNLVYCENDSEVVCVSSEANAGVNKIGYTVPVHEIRDGITYLQTDVGEFSLMVFGKHNLMNLEGARNICNQLGITNEQFYQAISTFKGAARRLELVSRSTERIVYKDFAHSPSKLKATIAAVKEQFVNRRLIACMELHTFSSLNAAFLDEYANSMNLADEAIVYFNAYTIEHKKLPPITLEQVRKSFAREDVIVIDTTEALKNHLHSIPKNGDVMLMMSSGTFDGLDLKLI
jgi:UDP-N-acetylmuramate: L-alanyl-gamma-D-glutamyl-meso-diaminopimelate ligase